MKRKEKEPKVRTLWTHRFINKVLPDKRKKKPKHKVDYYVGMVETVNRRIDKLPAFGLIIIDEAHIGNFNKLPFFR